MSVVVAGSFRIPAETFAALRPHLQAVIAETRKEDGCLAYAYAVDLADPELIRVFEQWRDQGCLDAHFQTSHMLAWQQVRGEHGFHDRQIWSFDVTDSRQI